MAVLLEGAAHGDEEAWHHLVGRYAALIWSVCRRHGVTGADAEDVNGVVWLQLVARLATIREPAALPGWLATTTRRECLAFLRHRQQCSPIPIEDHAIAGTGEPADAGLLSDERRLAVQEATAQLPERHQRLLSMLFSGPPMPYTEISAMLGVPIGAIGPTRQRCLARLRRWPRLVELVSDGQPNCMAVPARRLAS